MNIYLLNYTNNEENFLPFLSEQRRKTVENIPNPAVRREKIYSYALLCYGLFRDFGVSHPPVFSYGKRGKPYLDEAPEISFSISHAGGFAACACGGFPLGLDIQDIRPLKADISRKICTPSELDAVLNSPEPHREICRLWCIKESVGKLTGNGFAEGFSEIEASMLISEKKTFVTAEKDFFIALSAYERLPEISIVNVTENELFVILSKTS